MSESKCQNEYCKYRNDSRKNGCYWETEQDGCRYIDPCPFCGFKEVEINKTMGDSYYVYCDNCGARGSKCIESINAVSEWNSVISDARPKDRAKNITNAAGPRRKMALISTFNNSKKSAGGKRYFVIPPYKGLLASIMPHVDNTMGKK